MACNKTRSSVGHLSVFESLWFGTCLIHSLRISSTLTSYTIIFDNAPINIPKNLSQLQVCIQMCGNSPYLFL